MPPLPAVAGVIRLSLNFASAGGDLSVKNRTFWSYSGPAATDAQMVTWLTAISGLYTGHCIGLAVSDWTLTELIGEDLTSSTAAFGTVAASAAGDRAGGALPVGVCTLINYEVGRRYRGGKPRGYLPFGADADLSTPRVWSSSYLTTVTSDWGSFLGGIVSTPIGSGTINNQVNVSYYSGFTVVTNPITHRARNVPTLRTTPDVDVVSGFSVNAIIGSQRRRYQRS